jgi:ABC-type transport system involved in Fe-S cluster assembly fused permease/ATPase subunit
VFLEFGCRSIGKRIKSALLWVVTTAIVCALVLGILYGMYYINFCLIRTMCYTNLYHSACVR